MTSPTRSPPSTAGHPQVRAILGAVGATFVWALFDRAPLERWSVGRVTLAACLAEAGSDIPGALDRYQRLRIPRTSRLQAMSAANKARFHLPDGPAQRDRDARMAVGSTDWSF